MNRTEALNLPVSFSLAVLMPKFNKYKDFRKSKKNIKAVLGGKIKCSFKERFNIGLN